MKERLDKIVKRIEAATMACGRDPETIKLVAVSKIKPAETVAEAHSAGQLLFGENYIQEAMDKIPALSGLKDITWHFIGHLQSKKSKYAVGLFDLIHSVDSLKLAREINKQAEKIGKVQNILIQVNISQEDTKSGITEEETEQLIRDVALLENVSVKGLMTMPPYYNDPEMAKPYFAALKGLSEKIRGLEIPNVSMDELSMGMTGDFEAAIQEGATLVRIGTAIFGERQ